MILQVRKYISLFFLLLLLIFQSCKQKKIDEAEKLILDVSTLEYKLQLDFDQISGKFIQLETNDESIIGRIDKVITHKNRIFILDKELSKSIYIFTAKGRYLNKIAKIGQGPGEYIALDDITLTGNEIVILDIDQEKLIYYLDNQFRKERKIDQEFYALENFQQHFVCVNNSCFDESNCFKSILLDQNLQVKSKELAFEQNQNNIIWDLTSPLYKTKNSVYISEAFSNVIHQVNSYLEVRPFLQIDFGKNGIDMKKKNESRASFLKYIRKTDKAFLVDNFKQNKKLRYFTYVLKQSIIHFFQSMESEKSIMVQSIQSRDKIVLNPLHMDESNFYFSIDPKNIIKSDFNYKEKLGELKETDNPIIYSIPIGEMCRIIDKYKV